MLVLRHELRLAVRVALHRWCIDEVNGGPDELCRSKVSFFVVSVEFDRSFVVESLRYFESSVLAYGGRRGRRPFEVGDVRLCVCVCFTPNRRLLHVLVHEHLSL